MENKKVFVNGLIAKRHERAPQWVIVNLSFKAEEFAKFLSENQKDGWLNVDVKLGQTGKYYAEVNSYKKQQAQEKLKEEVIQVDEPVNDTISPEDIPF